MEKISEKELNAKRMFESLKRHIGQEVSIMYSLYGEMRIRKGILEEVSDFNYVMINGEGIPFIGYGSAIYIISSPSMILYKNEVTEQNFDKRNDEEILSEINKVFGARVAKDVAQKLSFEGFVPTETEEELGNLTKEELQELKEVIAELTRSIKENGGKAVRTVTESTPLRKIDRESLQGIIETLKKPAESFGIDGEKKKQLAEAFERAFNPSEEDIETAKAKLREIQEQSRPVLEKGKEKASELLESLKDLKGQGRRK